MNIQKFKNLFVSSQSSAMNKRDYLYNAALDYLELIEEKELCNKNGVITNNDLENSEWFKFMNEDALFIDVVSLFKAENIKLKSEDIFKSYHDFSHHVADLACNVNSVHAELFWSKLDD